MPIVSIIIPLYNRSELVKETLNSVQQQTFTIWELIVVDDGSTDTSLEVVAAYAHKDPRIKVFSRPADRPKGPSSCRNFGAEQAEGKYLIFLDSDDLLAPFCLEQRVGIMEEQPVIDLAIFNIQYFQDKPGDDLELFNKHTQGDRQQYIRSFLSEKPGWQTMGPIWKAIAFAKTNGFDSNLTCMEDPELHLRALLNPTIELAFCEKSPPDCYYRRSDFSEFGVAERFYDNSIRGRLRFYPMMWELIKDDSQEFIVAFQKGLLRFLKFFLLTRVKNYRSQFSELLHWIKSERILSSFMIFRISLLAKCWDDQKGIWFRLPIKWMLHNTIPD